ncbi:zinc finger protein ZXDC [Brachyistius frenatus]|uniref:zinc finger protein ZXDC n=1 Tax=Brachyistius frenatus TaxID=100188 RepID=UPI0037E9BA35
MEIQGLSDAQNIHSQHGVLHRSPPSPLRSAMGSRSNFIPTQNELLEQPEPQSDDDNNNNNNNRPRTSPFRLLAENGSEVARSPVGKPQTTLKTSPPVPRPTAGLHNANAEKEHELNALLGTHEFVRTGWRYGAESGDAVTQMALPLFEGEEEPMRQLTLPFPVLRQLRQDGASKQPPAASYSAGAAAGCVNTADRVDRTTQELYVVFNVVQEDGDGEASGRRPDASPEDGDQMKGKAAGRSGASHGDPMETGQSDADDGLNRVDAPALKKTEHVFNLLTDSSAAASAKQTAFHRTVEDVVLTNKYGDKICGQICTENHDGKPVRELSSQSHVDESGGGALISATTGVVEAMDTSVFISDSAELRDGANPAAAAASASPPASETFSGTITINNQSIIVTIENGILTLAAPPEGYVHKEDDMVSLKEHLGMKDHEDIVLLNYDSGTKSIGKISTLAVASSSQQDEPKPGLSVSDSELALVDDCLLSEQGTSLDSCPIVKQEAGVLCAVTEADLVAPCPKAAVADCGGGGEDVQAVPLIRSKKELVSTFGCPEPDCPCTFDTRQKLKVHLLNHAEDPRPYQCTVEGCGWAFATSYKLKRHLQSHDKQRPHGCQFEGCGRRFTTVYNLKAHVKVHEQDNAFICEICSERFRSANRLTNHQRVHFEPQRPHKCEFPGCEKTFITFSALFSHNRTHFRETGHFTCTYPGCDKTYDKACRLKIHMRSHTGERPFVCDSEGCGWSFTSMSKLLRHKRKHDDDRRFVCTEEGCGKSFTRAEHLKGHSITHLGTKPFQCHAEGCNAKFSARSSLYIHSKKHKQDASTLRTRCPVANCSKHFSSRSSLKSHMLKHHHLSPDVLSQMETTPTLTPSSELISPTPTTVAGPGIAGGDQLTNLDLSSLFSGVPGSTAPTAGIGVGIPLGGVSSNSTFTMDLSLVSSGILTIDPSSAGTALGTGAALAKAVDPLILAASADMGPHHGLEGTVGDVLPPQGTLNLDDVQTVTPEALGTLAALTMQGVGASADATLHHPLGPSGALSAESAASLAAAPDAGLLASPSKIVEAGGRGAAGPLLGCVEVLGPQEGGKVLTQFIFPGHSSSFSPQKDPELNAMSPSSFLESGGSARTDYRAIQLAKKKKQKGPSAAPGLIQRKTKGAKAATCPAPPAPSGARYGEGASAAANGGLTLRDPVTGAQYVQIQLLQDDPTSDGDLAFQLSSQPSSSHSQLTVDLPVNILQEPSVMTEDGNGSDNSQFTGSTINLQDLE